MKILLIYHSHYNRIGYFKQNKIGGHDLFHYHIDRTPQWTNLKDSLPFYICKSTTWPKLNHIEKSMGEKFDLALEIDGPGQHHIQKGSSRTPFFFWSHDIYRADKYKFQRYFQWNYDRIFCAHKGFCNVFNPAAIWLPFFLDESVYKPTQYPKMFDIGFVGNMGNEYSYRNSLLHELAKRYDLRTHTGIYGSFCSAFYSNCRIVFNKSHSREINLRVFEALGSGSFLLTDKPDDDMGWDELFQDGKHLDTYISKENLFEKVEYWLKNNKKREKIAKKGMDLALEKHTLKHRIDAIAASL